MGRVHPSWIGPRVSLRLTGVLLLAFGILVGCGAEEKKGAAPPPAVVLPPPVVPPVSLEDRAAYALDRLTRGPRPVGPVPVPEIHRRNLELAQLDLVSMEAQTLALLAQPKVIARFTGMARQNADPWHNILRVLLSIKGKPLDTVLSWTRPVLEFDAASPLSTLRLEAVRVLATVDDVAAAPLLLELFRGGVANRELSSFAFASLLHHGSPWRERTLQIALTYGTPNLWTDVWNRLASQVPPGETDPEVADLLSWWAGQVAGSGPRISPMLPHVKHFPWSPARLALDVHVPHAAGGVAYGPLPSSVTHGSGWYSAALTDGSIFPMYGYVLTGKLPAANARCALARWGYAASLASVEQDLLRIEADAGLYWTARHCLMSETSDDDDARTRDQVNRELGQGRPWSVQRLRKVQQRLSTLPGCEEEADWMLLSRILQEVRPLDTCRTIIEQTYDRMRPRELELRQVVIGLLRSDDREDVGVARHLMRWSRDPAYLPELEQVLAEAKDPVSVRALRRTVLFIYTRGYGIEPRQLAEFVQRFEAWLEGVDEQEFRNLVTALLDFGEPGASAYARGLSGPKRLLYLGGWPRDRRMVSLEVAKAALAPLNAASDDREVLRILAMAYSNFPPTSGSDLEALRRRLSKKLKPFVLPVLERVRHRAPRYAEIN